MSIVRVGLSEHKQFSDGYDAIFGKKKGGKKIEPNAELLKAAAKPLAAPAKKGAKKK